MASESQSKSTKTQPMAQMNGSYLPNPCQPNQSHGLWPSVPAFELRLPDHQKELQRFVCELFDEQLHTDCTIELDDGQYIKAHKLILSAFSSYFRRVFSRLSNCYPVIVVKDMHYEDLRSLIEFMYRGCITVPNHRLPQLVKCAKELKIRGLYESNEETNDENECNNCCRNVSNGSQTVETSKEVIEMKRKEFLTFDKKLDQKETIILDKNQNECNYSQQFVSEWLNNKKSFPIPSPPKFTSPVLTPTLQTLQKSIALDLTKRMSHLSNNHNSEQFRPMAAIHPPNVYPGFTSHPSLFRSISVDESQLMKNKSTMNGQDVKLRRGPSSLNGHLDDNNNDLEPDYRKEKKRNLNIFHAAKYRNRKKQQLETLFAEESELQQKNCLAKMQIEKLESTILGLIWQQTKKCFNSQTVFSCPVCGNAQKEVPKLRSHINMLHNDTEALMKFLMLQRSPTFAIPSTNHNNCNNSTKPVPNSTVSVPTVPSMPYRLNSNQ